LADILNNPILLYDNQLSSIYKTVDHLKRTFPYLVLAKTEEDYFDQLRSEHFDVIIASLDVAPMDGIIIAKETILQLENKKPFFIIYSAKQDDFIVELAYNNGVDAFVNFQNNPALMELQLKALIKRIQTKIIPHNHQSNWHIDEEEYLVVKNDKKIELPKKEFRILMLLNETPNKFYSKQELAVAIWNDEAIAKKRTIDVHIYNIRKLLGKRIIQSQKGKGYRINKNYFI